MRKSIITSIVLGMTLAFVGCPPADGKKTTTTPSGTDTAGGGDTTTEPVDGETGGGDAAPASKDADLSHVKVGQKYQWEMQNKMTATWEVLEVGPNMVKYSATMMMDMGDGPAPVGEPSETTWEYKVPAAAATTTEPVADKPKMTREEVTVSGIKFDCLVIESDMNGVKSKTWATMSPGSETVSTFPGMVDSQTDGTSNMKLVKVE